MILDSVCFTRNCTLACVRQKKKTVHTVPFFGGRRVENEGIVGGCRGDKKVIDIYKFMGSNIETYALKRNN